VVVKELSVMVEKVRYKKGKAFQEKVLQLVGLLSSVHILHLSVINSMYQKSDTILRDYGIVCITGYVLVT
jgi:hypothetical protein